MNNSTSYSIKTLHPNLSRIKTFQLIINSTTCLLNIALANPQQKNTQARKKTTTKYKSNKVKE